MRHLGEVTLIVILLLSVSLNNCFAKNIKYSIGPICNKNKVICKNQNELPVCLVLNPSVRVETITNYKNNQVVRYQPSCGRNPDNLQPTCVDIIDGRKVSSKEVVLECVEFAKCEIDQNTNKLTPICSSGKIAKCLGTNNKPNCNSESICRNGSLPVCDYEWQAFVPFQRG